MWPRVPCVRGDEQVLARWDSKDKCTEGRDVVIPVMTVEERSSGVE